MNVSGASSSIAYTPSAPQKVSNATQASGHGLAAQAKAHEKTDTATFSQEALIAQRTGAMATGNDAISQPVVAVSDLPIEAYAVPSWQTGFYRDITQETLTGNWISTNSKYAQLDSASKSDVNAYVEMLQAHTNNLYETNGLSDPLERYKALNSVPGLSERLHQQFINSVKSDSDMVALMNKLGIEGS